MAGFACLLNLQAGHSMPLRNIRKEMDNYLMEQTEIKGTNRG